MGKLLFVFALFSTYQLNAQNFLIDFSGTGASITVNTVKVENLTSGATITVNGSDILHLTIATGVSNIEYNQSSQLKIYPNPMTDYSIFEICPPVIGDAIFTISEMTGKPVAQLQSHLESINQSFRLSGLKDGFYFVSVKGNGYQFSGKLLSNRKSNGTISIEKVNTIINTVYEKITKTDSKGTQVTVDMAYTTGDRLKFTAVSGNYSTVITDIPASNKNINFNFIACTDGDNNNYPVVQIGTQFWMAENLKATKYNDGTAIPNVTDNTAWGALITGAYCDYNNTPSNSDNYGRLYNWYVVDNNPTTKVASNGGKNVCPTGWRAPHYLVWTTLETYMVANGYNYDGTTSGNKIAKSLAATTNWSSSTYIGTPGNTDYTIYRNKTGFTALPGGERNDYGTFRSIGDYGLWWSTTEYSSTSSWVPYMGCYDISLYNGGGPKVYGFSIRCSQE